MLGTVPTTKNYPAQYVNRAQLETLEGAFYIKATDAKYVLQL